MKTKTILIHAILAVATVFLLPACNQTGKENTGQTKNDSEQTGGHEHVYACPMHPEVTGKEGDKCSKCGMALVHADESAVKGNHSMKLGSVPAPPVSGKPATLSFIPVNSDDVNSPVPLDVVHEKKIHLIIVSEDLSWFSHIHPEYQSDGSYTVSETFPHGGTYFLYADYKPSGGMHQVDRLKIDVAGEKAEAKKYTESSLSSASDEFTVTLKPDGGRFVSNQSIHFDGVFTRNGAQFDVNDLNNYLEAKGHMVAIHTGTGEYVHLHPEVEGTILHFHTTFEKSGLYRVWLQFMAGNKLHTTSFVLNAVEDAGKSTASPAGSSGHGH